MSDMRVEPTEEEITRFVNMAKDLHGHLLHSLGSPECWPQHRRWTDAAPDE